MTKKNILLVEPGYPNKYPPLGLMKIAAYHGPSGRDDHLRFVKGDTPDVLSGVWDRVYVTTLFSFEWKRTSAAIDFALRAVRGQAERVFVGGIAATLMFDEFRHEPRWAGVRFIKGLLDQPAALSLELSAEEGDFGADHISGTPIEELVPNYSILEHIPYTYPVRLRVPRLRAQVFLLRRPQAGGTTTGNASDHQPGRRRRRAIRSPKRPHSHGQ